MESGSAVAGPISSDLANLSASNGPDQECKKLLKELLVTHDKVMWNGPVIFRLKVRFSRSHRVNQCFQEIFCKQQNNILTYGLYHPAVVSTSTLLRVTEDLICENFLQYHTPTSEFELELHLQCIISALRLLSLHGIYPGSGNVAYSLFDKLYNRLNHWNTYAVGQTDLKNPNCQPNFNSEFLLVFAKDLISSLPNDRTFTRNILNRIIAACTTVGHLVWLPISSQLMFLVVQQKFRPSCQVGQDGVSIQI